MKRNREPTRTKQHRPAPLRARGAARVIVQTPPSDSGTDDAIVERPDGCCWLGPDCDRELGSFDSREAARVDRDSWNEEAPSEGETVQEAGSEIGVADWIDAETGEPAEGQSPPHFEQR